MSWKKKIKSSKFFWIFVAILLCSASMQTRLVRDFIQVKERFVLRTTVVDSIYTSLDSAELGNDNSLATSSWIEGGISDSRVSPTRQVDSLIFTYGDGEVVKVGDFFYNSFNILYVSSSYGNNTTAVKGDIRFPWADPFTAGDAASPGDVVFMLKNEEFTIPTYSTTGDFNVHDEVIFYADRGVKISGNQPFFFPAYGGDVYLDTLPSYQGNTIDISLLGHAEFLSGSVIQYVSRETNGGKVDIALNPVPRFTFDFEVSYIEPSGQAAGFSFQGDEFDLNLKVENAILNLRGLFIISQFGSQVSTNFNDVTVNSKINNVTATTNGVDIRGVWGEFIAGPPRVYENFKVNYEVSNIDIYRNTTTESVEDAGVACSWLHDNLYRNSVINFNFGNIRTHSDPATRSTYLTQLGDYLVHRTIPRAFQFSWDLDSTDVVIHCDNCVSDYLGLVITGSSNEVSNNSSVKFTGNWRSRYSSPIFLDEITASSSGDNIYFDGYFISDSEQVIVSETGNSRDYNLTFSGTYQTLANDTPIASFSHDGNTTFVNAFIRRPDDGGADSRPAIISEVANTINVGGVYFEGNSADVLFGPNSTRQPLIQF